MAKNNNNFLQIEELSFDFIDNDTLKSNLAINLQYIIFLIQTEAGNELSGSISYSIFKNIILYTTSIIEGILTYALKTGIDINSISESKVMKPETKYKEIKEVYKINANEHIVCGRRVKGFEKFNLRRTSFNDVIKAAKKSKIIDNELASKLNIIREKRNKIHLASLTIIDDYYDKDEINSAFNLAVTTIRSVKSYLENQDK